VPPSEDNTLLFDVGAESCRDDGAVTVLDDSADDVFVDVIGDVVELRVKPTVDCGRDVVALDEPAV